MYLSPELQTCLNITFECRIGISSFIHSKRSPDNPLKQYPLKTKMKTIPPSIFPICENVNSSLRLHSSKTLRVILTCDLSHTPHITSVSQSVDSDFTINPEMKYLPHHHMPVQSTPFLPGLLL